MILSELFQFHTIRWHLTKCYTLPFCLVCAIGIHHLASRSKLKLAYPSYVLKPRCPHEQGKVLRCTLSCTNGSGWRVNDYDSVSSVEKRGVVYPWLPGRSYPDSGVQLPLLAMLFVLTTFLLSWLLLALCFPSRALGFLVSISSAASSCHHGFLSGVALRGRCSFEHCPSMFMTW